MFSSPVSNNGTQLPFGASNNVTFPSVVDSTLQPFSRRARPELDHDRRLDGHPLDSLMRREAGAPYAMSDGFAQPANRTARAALPGAQVFDHRIGNRTVTEEIRRFGEAVWNRPGANGTKPETIRQVVVKALGGRKSARGQQASRQFSEVHRYLRALANVRDSYVARHPQHAALLRDGANLLMGRAVDHLARGFHEGDARATYVAHIEPRLATARRELEQQAAERQRVQEQARAEQAVAQQTGAIAAFWYSGLDAGERWIRYVMTGELVFENEEEMERNCPAGSYQLFYNRITHEYEETNEFGYEGGFLQDVFVRQPGGGERRVLFSGPTWIYAAYDPRTWGIERDPIRMPSAFRRDNPHWNPDARVRQARVDGSRTNREG